MSNYITLEKLKIKVAMIRDYTTVQIPNALLREVEKVITEYKNLGYRNRSEFIIEATRRRIEEIKKVEKKEN